MSAKADGFLTRARHMQFLRLVLSAMMEGLVDGKIDVRIAVENQNRTIISHAQNRSDLARCLYRTDPAVIREVTIFLGATGETCGSLDSFLSGPLKRRAHLALGAGFSEQNWLKFEAELQDSLVNEARAFSEQAAMYGLLRARLTARNETGLFHYLTANPAADSDLAEIGHDAASLLTQVGSFSGHRTHPCAKTRLLQQGHQPSQRRSLTQEEYDANSPECAPDVDLPLLAVRREKLTVSFSRFCQGSYTEFFVSAFPGPFRLWEETLSTAVGAEAVDYFAPIPIHPLQAETIRSHFAAQIAAGDILFLPGAQITQRPTISFRTLMPVRRPTEPQIKTSLTMQMTSVLRTLAPARAFNAPVLSDLLLELTARDATLSRWLRPVAEPVSVYWGRDGTAQSDDYKSGYHLGAVFKANPSVLQQAGEIAIPLNTLLSVSPASGRRLIVEIMRDSGVDGADTALAYFRIYAEVVLGVDIGIFARYGISLETHQQNTDLIFDGPGRLRAIGYRDISGGLEIYEPLLAANGYEICPALHPNIRGLFDQPDFPLRQTIYVSFVTHLFPVIYILSAAFGVPEAQLFAVVAETVRSVLAEVRAQHVPAALAGLAPQARDAAARLFHQTSDLIERRAFSERIAIKCLLRMRAAQSQEAEFGTMDNPLAAH